MARVEVICEIEADGSVKVEVEASDRTTCAAEATALRERLAGKLGTQRPEAAVRQQALETATRVKRGT